MLSVKKVFELYWATLLAFRHKNPCSPAIKEKEIPKVFFQKELPATNEAHRLHAEVCQLVEPLLSIPSAIAARNQMKTVILFL